MCNCFIKTKSFFVNTSWLYHIDLGLTQAKTCTHPIEDLSYEWIGSIKGGSCAGQKESSAWKLPQKHQHRIISQFLK